MPPGAQRLHYSVPVATGTIYEPSSLRYYGDSKRVLRASQAPATLSKSHKRDVESETPGHLQGLRE